MARVETVEFNGIEFRRYPDSKRWVDREYFTPNGKHRAAGVGRLHQEVWKAANGPIPDGLEVHHIDRDTSNNALSNLECCTRAEHLARHAKDPTSARQLAHLARIRAAAAAWHGSEEGRAWHSAHARRTLPLRVPTPRTCEHCGRAFESVGPRARFCSNPCKTARRRAAGTDNEERVCAWCASTFTVNRYSKVQHCSPECGQRARRARPSDCSANIRAGLPIL